MDGTALTALQRQARGVLTLELVRPPDRRVRLTSLLLEATDQMIVTAHETRPSKPLDYRGERVVDRGYWAVWFVFKDRSYDVGRFYRPDGTWTGYYVNILEPVRWTGDDPRTLEPIVDLFLDLWIAPDGGYLVLDEDEFQTAMARGYLGEAQVAHARGVLRDLTAALARGHFPPAAAHDFRL